MTEKNSGEISTTSTVNNISSTGHVAQIIVQPLPKGFGITLGNSLRRILLSSLEGYAPSAVKISGVMHEFDIISGVKEDIVNIILNLKKLIVSCKNNQLKTVLKLQVSGPQIVTAEMLQTTGGVEILNKELVLCTITAPDTILEMDITVSKGKGYVSADRNTQHQDPSLGVIMLDSMFNPVVRATYSVEEARVGGETDYDKLILEAETNGTLLAKDAIGLAAKILQDHLAIFIDFENSGLSSAEAKTTLPFDPILLQKIHESDLNSQRAANCLKNENIIYLGDLVTKSEKELIKIKHFGEKSLRDLQNWLKTFKLKLGMDVPSWPPDNLEELSKKYEGNYETSSANNKKKTDS